MRILLVDDHLLFARGLQFLLSDLNERAVCVVATSIAQAVVQEGVFDLVLLDYALPDSQGARGLERVRQVHEGVPIVILSAETQAAVIKDLIEQGAAGFISKSSDTDVLLAALRTIMQGGFYLPPQVLSPVEESSAQLLVGLSPRQSQVLLKIMRGKTNRQIANEMSISENTVKTHIAAGFRVLEVSTRAEAVFKVASIGLMPPSAPSAPATVH